MFYKYITGFFCAFFAIFTWALDLELTQGITSALPIGIHFAGEDRLALEMSQVLNNDLRMSGRFAKIDSSIPSVSAFQKAGADSVVMGEVKQIGAGRYDVHVELIDAAANGRMLLTNSFQISRKESRALAHHISDLVYQKLTGERGAFSTKIAYIAVQRKGEKARYALEVADVDGFYPQILLHSSEPIMSPSWSPDGKKIAYVSFEKKRSQIFLVSIETGKRRLITNFTGINGAPAWSPDGTMLAVVLSKGGHSKIYSIELASGNMKQLTFGNAIDTEPHFAPDGKTLLFTSGRAGSPQVFELTLDSGAIRRITYEGNYNASASYTSDQKHIVMLHKEGGDFSISAQDTSNHQITQLTFSSHDESPSLAPNGRMILYATKEKDRGVLSIVSLDGRTRTSLLAHEGDVQEPAWSPYLG